MIRRYCEEARTYGEVPLPIGAPNRQITVVLNPASNGGYLLVQSFLRKLFVIQCLRS